MKINFDWVPFIHGNSCLIKNIPRRRFWYFKFELLHSLNNGRRIGLCLAGSFPLTAWNNLLSSEGQCPDARHPIGRHQWLVNPISIATFLRTQPRKKNLILFPARDGRHTFWIRLGRVMSGKLSLRLQTY